VSAPVAHHYYFRAGHVERGRRYEWRDAYSRVVSDGVLYPWLTKREAQSAAKSDGAKAVFHETEAAARAAMDEAGR
jgi:hypothetical protein